MATRKTFSNRETDLRTRLVMLENRIRITKAERLESLNRIDKLNNDKANKEDIYLRYLERKNKDISKEKHHLVYLELTVENINSKITEIKEQLLLIENNLDKDMYLQNGD